MAQTEALSLINAISDTLYRTLDFQAVIERAVNALVSYARFKAVGIFTLDAATPCLDLLVSRNFDPELTDVVRRLWIDRSLAGQAVMRREIMTSADIMVDEYVEPAIRDVMCRCGLHAAIVIPILYQTEVLGTVHLLAAELPVLNPLKLKTLMAIGRAIGLAMSNARYVNQVEAEVKERRRMEEALQESEARFRHLAALQGKSEP
jgi:GAF domain-containing protein